MDDKREQFAQSVLTWILEEMRYRPDTTGKFAGASLPTIQDLKKLCRGNTVAMWQYFLDHIRSKRTVETIRGNIELSEASLRGAAEKMQKDQQKKALIAKRDQIRAQIAAAKQNTNKVKFEIEQLRSELDSQTTGGRRKVDEGAKKARLLAGLDDGITELAALFVEYHQRIDTASKATKKRAESIHSADLHSLASTAYSSDNQRGEDDEGTLESAELASVRRACEQVAKYLEAWYDGNTTLAENLLQEMQSTLETMEIRPLGLIEALSDLTKRQSQFITADLEGASSLQQEISEIKLRLEEEFLARSAHRSITTSNKTTSNTNSSSSPTPTAANAGDRRSQFPTVEQLLATQREEHFSRFISAEHARNEAQTLQKQTSQMRQSLQTACLDSDENAGVAILNGVAQPQKHPVQELLDLEMELAGEQAALGALKHTMELLQENLRLFRRDLEQLKLKKERIEELEGQTRTKQTLIEELIKQNTQAKQDFDTKVRSIRGLSANKIGPIQHRVAKFVRELEDFVSKEVNTLERLDVKDLHVLSQESSGGNHHPAMVSSVMPSAAMKSALTALRLPPGSSSELMLTRVIELQQKTDEAAMLLSQMKNSYRQERTKHEQRLDEKHIIELEHALVREERDQREKWIPVLLSHLEQTDKALDFCATVKSALADWWTQPAQMAAPWLEVDGKSFPEHHSQWKDLVFQLHSKAGQYNEERSHPNV